MSKPIKVLAIVGSIVLVLLITLVVVAKVVITPERVRATVLPVAEEQLGRKVDFSGFGVSIFSGITLEGFTIYEVDGQNSFVSLEGLVLSPRILPLFTGRVVVDEVRLEKPRIVVVRNADGSFNFSSIGKAEEAQPVETADAKPGEESGGGIDLLVSHVAVSGGEVLYRDLALQPGQPFELTLADIEVLARDISLERSFPLQLSADLAGAPLSVNAEVDPHNASGNGSVTLQGLALKNFRALLGEGYPAHLEPLAIDLEISGSGSAEQAGAKGTCTLKMAGQNLVARFDAPALMKQPLPLTVDVTAGTLLLDKLLPPEKPAGKLGAESALQGGSGTSEELGPFDIPLAAKGQVAIESLGYSGLTLSQLRLDWSLVKNIFKVERLQSALADGTLQGTARVDLARKGLQYTSDIKLEKVQASPLVGAFYPAYRDAVHGGLDLALKASGKGTQVDALKRNLSGDGQFLVTEGKVEGAPLLEGLSTFLGSEELKVLSFKETGGSFTIKDGALLFDTRIDGSQARMAPKGQVTLDGGLDVRLETRLSPELTRKIAGKKDFAAALTDEEGWGVFPLRVKGSMDKPRFTLDSKAASKQATKKAVEELSKKIFKSDEEKAGQKVLEDALKGLLGN